MNFIIIENTISVLEGGFEKMSRKCQKMTFLPQKWSEISLFDPKMTSSTQKWSLWPKNAPFLKPPCRTILRIKFQKSNLTRNLHAQILVFLI